MHFSMGGFISHQLSLKRVFQKKKDRELSGNKLKGKRFTETEPSNYVQWQYTFILLENFFALFHSTIF